MNQRDLFEPNECRLICELYGTTPRHNKFPPGQFDKTDPSPLLALPRARTKNTSESTAVSTSKQKEEEPAIAPSKKAAQPPVVPASSYSSSEAILNSRPLSIPTNIAHLVSEALPLADDDDDWEPIPVAVGKVPRKRTLKQSQEVMTPEDSQFESQPRDHPAVRDAPAPPRQSPAKKQKTQKPKPVPISSPVTPPMRSEAETQVSL